MPRTERKDWARMSRAENKSSTSQKHPATISQPVLSEASGKRTRATSTAGSKASTVTLGVGRPKFLLTARNQEVKMGSTDTRFTTALSHAGVEFKFVSMVRV